MTKAERNALYSLRDDASAIVKEGDKRSGVVVWDREYYLAEAKNNLIRKFNEELSEDVEGPFDKVIKKVIKLRNRGDVFHKPLDYFSVNNPKLRKFYLLP